MTIDPSYADFAVPAVLALSWPLSGLAPAAYRWFREGKEEIRREMVMACRSAEIDRACQNLAGLSYDLARPFIEKSLADCEKRYDTEEKVRKEFFGRHAKRGYISAAECIFDALGKII